jgi:hypothetical protein
MGVVSDTRRKKGKEKMKALRKKDIDWLWRAAANEMRKCIFSVLDNCAIATDGLRAHVINNHALPDKIEGVTIDATLGAFHDGNIVSEFLINPKFLYDAMAGFLDQRQTIITLIESEDFEGITITADHSNNQAFIACIKRVEE